MKVKDILNVYHDDTAEYVGIYDGSISQPLEDGKRDEVLNTAYAEMEVKKMEISYSCRTLWLTVEP